MTSEDVSASEGRAQAEGMQLTSEGGLLQQLTKRLPESALDRFAEFADAWGRKYPATVFVATSGCTWRQLPPVFGPCWTTVYPRFAQWSRHRVWARLHRVILDEPGARGEPDWSRCAIDSVSLRATKGGH